jgi:hypothetical protein
MRIDGRVSLKVMLRLVERLVVLSLYLTLWWKMLQNVRKILERRQFSPLQRLCASLRKGRINHMILLEEKTVKEDVEEKISEAEGVGIIAMRNLIFNVSVVGRMDMKQRHAKYHGRRSKTSMIRKKTKVKHQI